MLPPGGQQLQQHLGPQGSEAPLEGSQKTMSQTPELYEEDLVVLSCVFISVSINQWTGSYYNILEQE